MGEAQDRQRKAMTPEAQQIAIAEACGWKRTEDGLCWYIPGEGFGNDPLGSLPDYLNDLNAMHKAEKVLTPQQQHDYSFQLSQSWLSDRRDNWRGCHATASQRSEAFLRTLGLWKDDK